MFPLVPGILKISDDKYGVQGSTTSIKNGIVGSSRNQTKSTAIFPGTLIGHFGIIKPQNQRTHGKIIPAKHPNNCLYAFEVADWLPPARA